MSVDRLGFRNRLLEGPVALWRICCPKPVMALLLSMVGVWLVRRYGLRGRHYGVFFIMAGGAKSEAGTSFDHYTEV